MNPFILRLLDKLDIQMGKLQRALRRLPASGETHQAFALFDDADNTFSDLRDRIKERFET